MNRLTTFVNECEFLLKNPSVYSSLKLFIKSNLINRYDWIDISSFDLTITFIRKFQHKIDWIMISTSDNTEDFIREFQHKVHWKFIISYKFSEDFIKEFQDKINWNFIRINKHSFYFIKEYQNKLNWEFISKDSFGFIDDIEYKYFCKIIRVFESKLNLDIIVMRILNQHSINNIMMSPKNKKDFCMRFHNKFNWSLISEFGELDEDFIELYKDNIIWKCLSKNKNNSDELYKKYFVNQN